MNISQRNIKGHYGLSLAITELFIRDLTTLLYDCYDDGYGKIFEHFNDEARGEVIAEVVQQACSMVRAGHTYLTIADKHVRPGKLGKMALVESYFKLDVVLPFSE